MIGALFVLVAYIGWAMWRDHKAAAQFDRDTARSLEETLKRIRRKP